MGALTSVRLRAAAEALRTSSGVYLQTFGGLVTTQLTRPLADLLDAQAGNMTALEFFGFDMAELAASVQPLADLVDVVLATSPPGIRLAGPIQELDDVDDVAPNAGSAL